jgi:hypothetical protein
MNDIRRVRDFLNGAFFGAVGAATVLIGGYLASH